MARDKTVGTTQIACGNGNIQVGGGHKVARGSGNIQVNDFNGEMRQIVGGNSVVHWVCNQSGPLDNKKDPCVVGEGGLKSENRPLPLESPMDVTIDIPAYLAICCGAKNPSMSITAQENLLPFLQADVSGPSLVITSIRSFSTQKPIRVVIDVPSLKSLCLRGAGETSIERVKGGSLSIKLMGSGEVRVDGKIDHLGIELLGSGDVDARDALTNEATLSLLGSGDIMVRVTEEVAATLLGSGDIVITGSPAKVSTSCLGSGEIRVK